ncbi:MAG: hypothetical protein Fur0022_19460 [Anaerolineales bacterium]
MKKFVDQIRNPFPGGSEKGLSPEETTRLETALSAALVSVSPRAEFVERLNRQLITAAPLARKPAAPSVTDPKVRENLLIGAATLLGAAAIFATGFRVAITLIGTIGILIQWLNRKSSQKPQPVI